MKKILKNAGAFLCVLAVSSCAGSAVDKPAAEKREAVPSPTPGYRENDGAAHRLACIDDYKGEVSTVEYYGTNGGIRSVEGNVPITIIDSADMTEDYLWKFAFYNERIYYLTSQPGSDVMDAAIYSCDMNHSDIKLITDKVTSYSGAFMLDGTLYYDGYSGELEFPFLHSDGVYRTNTLSDETEKLVSGTNIELLNVTDDSIFYADTGDDHETVYYKADIDGSGAVKTEKPVMNRSYITKDRVYAAENNQVLWRDIGEGEFRLLEETDNELYTYIDNVTEKYVYYSCMELGGAENIRKVYRTDIP